MTMRATPLSNKRIGELLMQRGLLTSRQLDDALTQQRSTGEFLGAILQRRGWVTPEALLEAFSERFGIPQERVSPAQVDWAVVKGFPVSVLLQGDCFPIRADALTVTVAISNPLDAWSLSAMERAAGTRTIKPVLVLERELAAVIQAYQHRALQAFAEHLTNHGNGKPQ